MNEFKQIFKSTIIYFFGNVGTKLISFLLLPLYTAKIPPNDYGLYDVNITYAILISSVLFLDIWTGIMKFLFENKDQNNQKVILNSGMIIFISSSILYIICFILFGMYKNIQYLWLVCGYGLSMCLQNLFGYFARSFGQDYLYAFSGTISTILNASLNIFLIIVLKMDYKSLYISYIIGILVQCLIIEYKIKIFKNINLKYFNFKVFKDLLYFSLPLCINSLCYWFLTGYNKIILTENLSSAANGYYAVAAKFSAALSIVSSCFLMAWQEISYKKYTKSDENSEFYSRTTNIYIKSLLCGYIIMLPIIYLIFPILVSSDYVESKPIIPMYMLATIASIVSSYFGSVISTYKRNDILFLSTLIASVVNIAIVYSLINKLGVHAANLGLLFGYLANNFIRVFIISKEIKFNVEVKDIILIIPFIFIAIYIFRYGNIFLNLTVLIMGIIMFIIIFYQEIILFKNVIINRIKKE